jgi:ubiquinone/menaquinone biosynthesis C-methylase UbiE
MAGHYYSSGEKLLTNNQLAGGAALAVAEFALGKLDLKVVARAVDAGCGWGRLAIPLLRRGPRLTDLICADVSPGMVRTCRSMLAGEGLRAAFVTADVDKLPLGGRFFDLAHGESRAVRAGGPVRGAGVAP